MSVYRRTMRAAAASSPRKRSRLKRKAERMDRRRSNRGYLRLAFQGKK